MVTLGIRIRYKTVQDTSKLFQLEAAEKSHRDILNNLMTRRSSVSQVKALLLPPM